MKQTPELKPQIRVRETAILATDSRQQYREKLARITLDSMVQFVGLLDAQGTVLEINKVALDAVGIKLADVEGKPFWTSLWWQVSPEINQGIRDAIARAAQGEFVRWDTPIYGRAGGSETIIIDASVMPVKDDDGNVVFLACEGRDITEKKAVFCAYLAYYFWYWRMQRNEIFGNVDDGYILNPFLVDGGI